MLITAPLKFTSSSISFRTTVYFNLDFLSRLVKDFDPKMQTNKRSLNFKKNVLINKNKRLLWQQKLSTRKTEDCGMQASNEQLIWWRLETEYKEQMRYWKQLNWLETGESGRLTKKKHCGSWLRMKWELSGNTRSWTKHNTKTNLMALAGTDMNWE